MAGLLSPSAPRQPQGLLQVPSRHNGGVRPDGTKKGNGWLGILPRPDGSVSTELSIGVNLDGNETLIPTLVPTLDAQEVQWLLTHDPSDKIPKSIVNKAADHAVMRMKAGKSPFAD